MNIANLLEVQSHPEFSTIHFFGFIDAATTEQARAIVSAKIPVDCANIIIDLNNVEFLDSHGIGFFVSLLKRVHKNSGHLFFSGAAGQPASVLQMVGFNGALVTYCDDIQQAHNLIQERKKI